MSACTIRPRHAPNRAFAVTMAEPTDRATVTLDEDAAVRLQAIAVRLSLAGITTHLYRNCGIPDLTATMRLPGHREVDVIVDEDGYTELRYWADPVATPAEVAYAITSALAAITPNLASSADAASRRMPGRASGPITGYDGAVTECAGDGTMPGPPDQLTEPGQSPESVRPRESDPADAELRQRMEQLRPGHPSSPYKGDGSPKPPVPDPFKNELPIPGDPGYQPAPPSASYADAVTDQELPTGDQAKSGAFDAREREERRLSLITHQAVERCRAAEGRDAEGNYGEHGLTPAMHRIESQLDYGHLAEQTEEYALKSPDRFKEKLAERISRFPKADPTDLAAEIHDGIRYTFVFGFESYTSNVELAQAKLAEAGYDHVETKPGWHGDEYKGVNSQWIDPASGLLFEVQFHTAESWSAKQLTHEAYEKIRSQSVPVEEIETLRAYQCEVSGRVPIPPGALDIPTYKKEG